MNKVVAEIRENVRCLLEHDGFQDWKAQERLEPGDYVLVNNSFVFRDVKTVKSKLYLCLKVADSGELKPDPKIATYARLISDFKRLSVRSRNLPTVRELNDAVSDQIRRIGLLIFLLIGKVQDRIVVHAAINHAAFDSISWDPRLNNDISISDRRITVREVHDEERIWQLIEKHFRDQSQDIPSGLREALGVALDKLQDQAEAEVEIPSFGARVEGGITDAIVQVLRDQRARYRKALDQYLADREPSVLNEILRIAYNFASDATGYIKLVVSICDLKPIVLWGTIAQHYALSEEFRCLPWTRSRNKPSLKNYKGVISDARNSTFHNLFPFRKTLSIPLPANALQGARLRIFSEHRRKKENELAYQDKELVDVLTQFTRAREQRPSHHFWHQNLRVMDATIALFERTSDFLKILHASLGDHS